MKIASKSILTTLPFVLAMLMGLTGLLTPSIAGAAARVKPSAGDYEAHPVDVAAVYQPGAFSVVNEGGKRRIVSSELYQGIFYPQLGKCGSPNVPLETESIPVSSKGRFSIREKTPVKQGSLLIVWKGRWLKPKRVGGTLKISYRNCTSKIEWAGGRVTSGH